MIKIAPSLLSADMAQLAQEMSSVEAVSDYIHCDVMDGHFVPNLTFGAPVVRWLKRHSTLPLDVHLMIENPGRWVGDYLAAGLSMGDFLTFHVEAEDKCLEVLASIRKAGVGAGISLKPGTPFQAVEPYLNMVDQILVMTVEPGFGGQSFNRRMLEKIAVVANAAPENCLIAVDGGIDIETAPDAARYGARLLVAGSAIFRHSDRRQAVMDLRRAAEDAL